MMTTQTLKTIPEETVAPATPARKGRIRELE